MESQINLDPGMGKTRLENVDATTNRKIIDIQKAIDDEFEEEIKIKTFVVNKYNQSRPNPTKQKVVQLSNLWTNS